MAIYPVSAFDILLVAHLVGDYLFQTEWMAKNKANHWGALLVHCSVYTAIITLFAFLFIPEGISIWGVVIVFVTHVLLDRQKFVTFWYRHIMQVKDDRSGWLKIIIDQTFHLIVLAVVVWL